MGKSKAGSRFDTNVSLTIVGLLKKVCNFFVWTSLFRCNELGKMYVQ